MARLSLREGLCRRACGPLPWMCVQPYARVWERRDKGRVALVVTRSLRSRSGMLRTDSSFACARRHSLTSSELGQLVSATREALTAERINLASAASSLSCITVSCMGGEGGVRTGGVQGLGVCDCNVWSLLSHTTACNRTAVSATAHSSAQQDRCVCVCVCVCVFVCVCVCVCVCVPHASPLRLC